MVCSAPSLVLLGLTVTLFPLQGAKAPLHPYPGGFACPLPIHPSRLLWPVALDPPVFHLGLFVFLQGEGGNAFYPRVVAVVSLSLLLLFAFLLSYFKVDIEEKWYFAHPFLSPVLLWLSLDLFRPLFERERIGEVFKTSPFIFFSHIFFVYSLKLPLTAAINRIRITFASPCSSPFGSIPPRLPRP